MTDTELVRQAQAGRAEAYAELVRRWAGRVTALCHAQVGCSAQADDLAQEALLRGFRALDSLQQPDRFGAWLCQIARRACLDWLKTNRRAFVPFSTLDHDPDHFPARPADECPDRAEELARLEAALASLPADYREVILLYYHQDVTYRDLAELLGVSAATVNARLTSTTIPGGWRGPSTSPCRRTRRSAVWPCTLMAGSWKGAWPNASGPAPSMSRSSTARRTPPCSNGSTAVPSRCASFRSKAGRKSGSSSATRNGCPASMAGPATASPPGTALTSFATGRFTPASRTAPAWPGTATRTPSRRPATATTCFWMPRPETSSRTGPGEAQPWRDLARSLEQEGELDLANLAYQAAFEAEPTNAEILWEQAQLLKRSGRGAEARRVLGRIAQGQWQPRFNWIQSQARQQAGR